MNFSSVSWLDRGLQDAHPICAIAAKQKQRSNLKSRKAQSHFLDATKFFLQRMNCSPLDHYPPPFLRHNGFLYQLHTLFHYSVGHLFQLCTSSNFLGLATLSTLAHIYDHDTIDRHRDGSFLPVYYNAADNPVLSV